MGPSHASSHKSLQLVDTWSAVHLGVWTAAGALGHRLRRRGWSLPKTMVTSLGLAIGWEVVELSLAHAIWGNHETPANRWISDPLTAVLGAPLGWNLAKALS